MAEITAYFESAADTPLVSPATAPTIRIRRLDTNVLVVTDDSMTEVGDGIFSYDFTTVDGLEYSIRADGDPIAAGQATAGSRYANGSISGTTIARVETDIPLILVDTDTTIPGLISGLNDLSIADVQTALTNQGYTSVRAALLDNLDATISSRATVATILAAVLTSGDTLDAALSRLDNIDADVAVNLPAGQAALSAQITALNDISIADVQTALTNQGYTSARALLLDNLDAAISSVITAISGLNDVSIADVQTAMTNQGYTAARAVLLDDLVTILASVEKIRKVTSNLVVVNASDTQVDVYEDNGTTIAFSFTISGDRRTRTPI